MKNFDFDLFVVGAGSGGVRAARLAAQHGVRVAAAEAAALGGTCVNVGCIPKKLYSYAAGYAQAFEEAEGYGWHVQGPPKLDWTRPKAAQSNEISRLNGVYDALLHNSGVTLFRGRARFIDRHTVEVNGQRHTAQHFIVATSGRPYVPEMPGREHLVTSDAMFSLPNFPKRLLIIGGGYIACEFASIFNGLGAQVTQLHRSAHLLTGFDHDVHSFLTGQMGSFGVDVRLNTEVASIARGDGGYIVTSLQGLSIEVDTVLCATGRVPNTEGLGLEAAGVQINAKGAVEVDVDYRTSASSVYAVGDVSTRVQLTPVALVEAMVVVDALFGKGERRMDYAFIPTAVFTHPTFGTCGHSESDARAAFGDDICVFTSEFKPLRHMLSGRKERTFMKLVVQKSTDRVVGLHMVGADAGEIVQGFAVAMRAGAKKAVFDGTVGIHPTAAEEFVTMRVPLPG